MSHSIVPAFYSGTSGLVLPVPNKSYFPLEFQDKSRLVYYASLFNSLEVNSSFYKIPLATTVKKWADETPDYFQFTYKLWKGITHNKGFVFDTEDVNNFMQTIANVGNKSGCLLVQLPPSATVENADQLVKLLEAIQQSNALHQWKVAVEFRHKSWYQQKTYNLLSQQNATYVLHDMPISGSSASEIETDFVYLRFHGVKGNYRGGYTKDFLEEYAGYIAGWQKEGKSVYVYFNNTMGDAVKNLITLNEFVKTSNHQT